MPRESRSPPRYRARYDDPYRASRHTESSGRRRDGKRQDDPSERQQKDNDGRRDQASGRSRRDDYREYRERDRERERERDRGRYDQDRDRGAGSSSRRSASPRPRSSRPRSHSGSPPPVDKAKPNFAQSGLLAAETNTVKATNGDSTILKYNEPPEARKPLLGWRLYVFKGPEQVELLHIHRQSAYLFGRDHLVADIAVDHPSCSKQHAVIQYRFVQEKDEYGGSKGVVKPFIIDLESTNGTNVNDEKIPAARFYELKASDVIKFGLSTREYVLLHDEAA